AMEGRREPHLPRACRESGPRARRQDRQRRRDTAGRGAEDRTACRCDARPAGRNHGDRPCPRRGQGDDHGAHGLRRPRRGNRRACHRHHRPATGGAMRRRTRQRIGTAIALVFGLGRLPAPGPFGAFAALPLAWLAHAAGGIMMLIVITLAVWVIGYWASMEYLESIDGR